MGLMPNKQSAGEATSAGATNGDPQVFYFGVFDGHGGSECSEFLREELHEYIENASSQFDLKSNLKSARKPLNNPQKAAIASIAKSQLADAMGLSSSANSGYVKGGCDDPQILELENTLIDQWKETVGGYFRRFKPQYFCTSAMEGGSSKTAQGEGFSQALLSIEKVLMYAFLRADLDFVTAQATKPDPESGADLPLNHDEVLGEPSRQSRKGQIGGPTRFKGGSTASIAMISTPTPTPFWNPSSPSTLVVAHVGDTRILLCETSTGLATAATTNHHPSTPVEGTRLRRYAAAFVTDSFGEERMSGLANTRAFGDMRSKRIGVSAEPEIRRYELGPAQYSFLALVSDGVSGTLSDQEIVDVIKEAKTPEQGARDVVAFATEVSKEGDNATCLVVRLGGWERRGEGGMGSLGTKEIRDYRRQEATDPRSRRT
jgi:protein phosphatase PTC6